MHDRVNFLANVGVGLALLIQRTVYRVSSVDAKMKTLSCQLLLAVTAVLSRHGKIDAATICCAR